MAMFSIVTSGETPVVRRLTRLGQQGLTIVRRVLSRQLLAAVGYARKTHLSGGSDQALHPRSGDLRNAFWFEVSPTAGHVTARLGFIRGRGNAQALRYAWTHEYGATIRPKRGRYLRVPAPFALTAAGRLKARYNVEDARQIPNTRIIRSKSGTLAIWESLGKGRMNPLFWLVRQVRVRARPTLGPTWRRFRPLILDDLRAELLKRNP